MGISRQGYHKHIKNFDKPDKHADLLAKMLAIRAEDKFNDTYGRPRLLDALLLQGWSISESTLYRVLTKFGLLCKTNKPKGLTKQDKEAYKNDDLLKGEKKEILPETKSYETSGLKYFEGFM